MTWAVATMSAADCGATDLGSFVAVVVAATLFESDALAVAAVTDGARTCTGAVCTTGRATAAVRSAYGACGAGAGAATFLGPASFAASCVRRTLAELCSATAGLSVDRSGRGISLSGVRVKRTFGARKK